MPSKKTPQTFSEALGELEKIAERFEQGEVDVEKGLGDFERALELAAFCKTKLNHIEVKVKEIQKKFV